jgi:tetratricopeptide (TPR) repeat protein
VKLHVLFLSVLLAQTASAQYPPVVTRSRLDPERGVNFHAVLLPDTVYVGQQSTYQIGVFLNQDVRQRLRRNPEFVPPETRSLLVYDLPDAKGPLVGTIDGRQYEVHVFQRAFFALSPGNYDIPPSKLTYALPQSASFFSREESHTLRSELRTLVVLPVPTAGRPDDWGGAVGEWRARLRVDSALGRVGNPLVVTLRIEGQGNVTLLPRPKLTVEWGSLVAADERVDFDSTPSTLRGAKEFDWLLTPRMTGRQMVPPQRFSYFDPVARRFELATTAPISVTVAAGDPVAADSTPLPVAPPESASAPPPLSIRSSLGDASQRSPLRSTWFLVLMAIMPLPALIGVFVRRQRRTRRVPTHAERLVKAARAVTPSRDAATLRRMLHDALRDRLGFDAGLALASGSVVAALRHEGVTVDTARRAETLLRLLDAAVFSGEANANAPEAPALAALYASIDTEARRAGAALAGRTARRVARALLVVACCGALPVLAWQGDVADKSWAAAQVAFASADYTRAERHFLDAARVHPDYANAWANAGTAAWMAADTARAVQGWQRAMRLRPLDREMRDRLALVRAVQDRGPARVAAVPVHGPAFILLFVWIAGWAAFARRAWRRRPFALRAAWLIVTCAAIVGAAAWLDEVQRADFYVVVTRPEPLRTLPVLGSEPGPVPLTGEVGHVLQRQGAWALVQLDGQRQGWMAAELLLPLGSD